MNESDLIPFIPDNAPFTAEQRAYLNGFLAGLFSRRPAPELAGSSTPPPTIRPLTILFGSQTGTSEVLAKRTAKELGGRGFKATIHDLSKYPESSLANEKELLLITSTYGDGEPPDNAKAFWQYLHSEGAPPLKGVRFSVLALGDTNYPKFCECGKSFDTRLEQLGATRLHPRVDCDVDYESSYLSWVAGVLQALDTKVAQAQPEFEPSAKVPAEFGKSNPFPARLLLNRKLNQAGSSKDTRHFEISLEGSGLEYEVGDALGVQPANCGDLVNQLCTALRCTGEEAVPGKNGVEVSVREALLHHYEVAKIPAALLKAFAERTKSPELTPLTAPNVNGELTKFLWGRDIIDLFGDYPEARFTPAEFIACLKKLQPRLYSISSSPKAHPGQVHLTVAVVRYQSRSRERKGVCSTFLADRVGADTPVKVFVQPTKHFRLPSDGTRPVIMIGPGTGVAPFRAFLEERRETGATGKTWLFFGDQHAGTDFLYREELQGFVDQGVLTRLDTAFSRDQEDKLYVQHRMLEHAGDIYDWLENGAHLYVCGDAQRMAKDVERGLVQIVAKAGQLSEEAASAYVKALKAEGRYQRDVY